jgi:hypothetical protein
MKMLESISQKVKIRFRDATGPQLRLEPTEVRDGTQRERRDLDRCELTFNAASIGLSPRGTLDAIHQLSATTMMLVTTRPTREDSFRRARTDPASFRT